MVHSIGILDDEEDIRYSLSSFLLSLGHKVFTYAKSADLLKNLVSQKLTVIFLDVNLGESKTGINYIEEIQKLNPECKIIIISGNADIRTAVTALKKGAYDFIEKPLQPDEIERILTGLTESMTIKKERNTFLDDILSRYELTGSSDKIMQVKHEIEVYASLEENILIQGENGTGKELVAANIHYRSQRKSGKYYKVNIAALPENLIESELFGYVRGAFSGADIARTGILGAADGSTLFMDEIGEMKYELQSKLLRVIQEKEYTPVGANAPVNSNARFVFATNRNLPDEIAHSKFREDLYYRISTLVITIPPLRDRRADIPLITEKFLYEFASDNNLPVVYLTNDALDKLVNYHFPGNVRELKNVLTRACVHSIGNEYITSDALHLDGQVRLTNCEDPGNSNDYSVFTDTKPLAEKKKELEKLYIEAQLKKFNYDKHLVSDKLGILVNNLYRKL